jgi:hypothetical protein
MSHNNIFVAGDNFFLVCKKARDEACRRKERRRICGTTKTKLERFTDGAVVGLLFEYMAWMLSREDQQQRRAEKTILQEMPGHTFLRKVWLSVFKPEALE